MSSEGFQRVADQVMEAVVPARGSEERVREAVRALPVAGLPALGRDGSMQYRISVMDHRGRVAEWSLMQVLGWCQRDPVDLAVSAGAVVCRRDRCGAFRLTSKGHVQVPASVRRSCGLVVGERVLLAAAPGLGVLVVHSMAALDVMVVDYHAAMAARETA
ncbi:hypothetical protein FHX42_001154 [Saccharopolyspora lacisalsi]|uniref:SpoVT-AbrB domain-containing protein n=1 Tax=Halosaccharopolyspora lacisalsi TaxID=1000566 RepID=A0A839DWV9_9PSEU|nr:hypothetical protein [Halosaccharopolyspora lacisalsi]MBA8823825.1 hypothetical protein [Halosaccharopolyspora lacisalsi]